MTLKILKLLLIFGASLFLFVGCSLFVMQRKLLYYPDNRDFFNCPQFNDYQKLSHKGTRFYFKQNANKLIVFYHGNAGSACDRAFLKTLLEENKHSVIFVEYTGYSNDSRTPTKSLLEENVKHIMEFIQTQDMEQVIVIGESIGSAMACFHTTQMNVNKLLLLSPFETLVNLVQEKYPLFPVSLLLKDKYNNRKTLNSFSGKIKIVHGTDDQLIPIHHAQTLFQNLHTSKKNFIEIEGAGHNDLYSFNQTIQAIKDYLH